MVSGQKSHADRRATNTAQRVNLNAVPLKFGEILKFQSGAVVFSSVFGAAFRRARQKLRDLARRVSCKIALNTIWVARILILS